MSEQSHLLDAAHALQEGGIVVFPTDTAYGIGCLYDNTDAIAQVMTLKGRTDEKFTVIASSLEQVERYFPLTAAQRALAEKYWPGPLSIIVSGQFSIRVPDSEIARQLAAAAEKPIIATSANKSGNPATYALQDAQRELGEQGVAVWIDGGALPPTQPSTVVRVHDDGECDIVRQGPINPNE